MKEQTSLKKQICNEVQIHYKRPLFDVEKKITNSKDSEKILRDYIDADRIDHKEFFWIMLLTNASQVLGISEIAVGCSNSVTVNFKEICQLALLSNSASLLVAHNHPSGVLQPSKTDRQFTFKLKKTLALLDINLLDHLIISSEGYYSFTDNDQL